MRISCRVAIVATLVAVATTVVMWRAGYPWRSGDAELYESQAYRLVTTGAFVRPPYGQWAVHDGERYSTHPVGYVVYVATIYWFSPEVSVVSEACIIDPLCEAGRPVRDRMHMVGAALRGLSAGGIVLVTSLFGAPLLIALAAGLAGMVLMLTQWDTAAVLAGVLLLAHAALSASAWQRPSILGGILAGVTLGALVLVRSVYLYSLIIVPLVWMVGIWRIPSERRRTAPLMALTLSACLVVGPWMARNRVQGGAFAVSAGGSSVMAIRAEYGLMTWPEVGRAFAYYLSDRVPFKGAAMRWLADGPDAYARFDRADHERGAWWRAATRRGAAAALADARDPEWRTASIAGQDAAHRAAALSVYREHWVKQLALTVVFLHRGNGGAWLVAAPLFLVLVYRRRDYRLAFLLVPMLATAGILAIGTHYVLRYSFPFIPVGTVLLALALKELLAVARDRWTARRA